jgi:hypothetical protein
MVLFLKRDRLERAGFFYCNKNGYIHVKVAMKTITKKRGRPRIHNNPVWFGMKISLKERELIKKFAREKGTSASRAIMEMVANALKTEPKLKQRMTASDMLKLPMAERNRLLRAQAKKAEWIYKNDSDLLFPDNQDIIEY